MSDDANVFFFYSNKSNYILGACLNELSCYLFLLMGYLGRKRVNLSMIRRNTFTKRVTQAVNNSVRLKMCQVCVDGF